MDGCEEHMMLCMDVICEWMTCEWTVVEEPTMTGIKNNIHVEEV